MITLAFKVHIQHENHAQVSGFLETGADGWEHVWGGKDDRFLANAPLLMRLEWMFPATHGQCSSNSHFPLIKLKTKSANLYPATHLLRTVILHSCSKLFRSYRLRLVQSLLTNSGRVTGMFAGWKWKLIWSWPHFVVEFTLGYCSKLFTESTIRCLLCLIYILARLFGLLRSLWKETFFFFAGYHLLHSKKS